MKREVRMKTCMAGVDTVIRLGERLLLDADIAQAWVDAGMAVYVEGQGGELETATMQATETATLRPARKRKGAR